MNYVHIGSHIRAYGKARARLGSKSVIVVFSRPDSRYIIVGELWVADAEK